MKVSLLVMASANPRPARDLSLTTELERRLHTIEGTLNTINVARHLQQQSVREADNVIRTVEQSYLTLGDQVSEAIGALSVARDLLSGIQQVAILPKQGARLEELSPDGAQGVQPAGAGLERPVDSPAADRQEIPRPAPPPPLRPSRSKTIVLAVEGPAAREGKPGETRVKTRNGWRWISEERIALIQCPESLAQSQFDPDSPLFGLHRFLEIFIPSSRHRRNCAGRPLLYTVHLECQYCLSRLTGQKSEIAHDWITAIQETDHSPFRYCRYCGQSPPLLNPLSEQSEICEHHPNAPSYQKLILLQDIEQEKNSAKTELWEREQSAGLQEEQLQAARSNFRHITRGRDTRGLIVVESAGDLGRPSPAPPLSYRPPALRPGSNTAGAAAAHTAGAPSTGSPALTASHQ